MSSISNKSQTVQKKKTKSNETQQVEPAQQLSKQILNEEETGKNKILFQKYLIGEVIESPILNAPAPTLQQIEPQKEIEQIPEDKNQQEYEEDNYNENDQDEQEILEEAENMEKNKVDYEGISYKQPNPASAQIMIVQEAESEKEDEIEIVDPDEVVEQVQSLRERLRAFRM